MPHLVVLYTAGLERLTDVDALCRALADTLIAQRDDRGAPVFPVAGTRVLAYPAAHHAIADGSADHEFVYMNLRVARGRSEAILRRAGDALADVARAHFVPLLATRAVGITLQIDESPGQVYDAKLGNLHALFAR